MIFFLGIVVGIVISVFIVVVETYLVARRKGLVESVIERVGRITRPKAEIIFPKTDEEAAQEELVDKNAKRGEGTSLKDLGM